VNASTCTELHGHSRINVLRADLKHSDPAPDAGVVAPDCNRDYEIHTGSIVFAPANTWMAFENTGPKDVQLIFIYSAPGFERYMRCISIPVRQSAPPLSIGQLRGCAGGWSCGVSRAFEYINEITADALQCKPRSQKPRWPNPIQFAQA
jgi:hypothetical protein